MFTNGVLGVSDTCGRTSPPNPAAPVPQVAITMSPYDVKAHSAPEYGWVALLTLMIVLVPEGVASSRSPSPPLGEHPMMSRDCCGVVEEPSLMNAADVGRAVANVAGAHGLYISPGVQA